MFDFSKHQRVKLAFWGSGLSAIAVGIWTIFTYAFPANTHQQKQNPIEQQQNGNGNVLAGRDIIISNGTSRPDVSFSYVTDPSCQAIISAAETISYFCDAYIATISDEIEFGKKSTLKVFRRRALQDCVDGTNSLYTYSDNNGSNIPGTANYDLGRMMDAVREFSQTLVFTKEKEIPGRISPKRLAFEESIKQLRVACKKKIQLNPSASTK